MVGSSRLTQAILSKDGKNARQKDPILVGSGEV